MANSYYAKYWSVGGGTLIGGVKESRTSRYEYKEDAEFRLAQIIELNGGRERCDGQVVKSFGYPEIFLHCGTDSSSIGSHCPGCRKILTVADAKALVGLS